MPAELSVITHCYDLLIWTINHTEKFSRSHRFTLGQRIEQNLYELLELLVEAKYTQQRIDVLRRAALRVEQLRLLYRVSTDLKLLAVRSHQFACRQLHQIGSEIGGWRKQATR